MLDLFEKLINEHGSSAILKERIALIQAEYTAIQRKCADLEAENKALKAQIGEMTKQLGEAQRVAGKQVFCKACGREQLERIGARRDTMFGDVGIERIVFRCKACGAESDFLDALNLPRWVFHGDLRLI